MQISLIVIDVVSEVRTFIIILAVNLLVIYVLDARPVTLRLCDLELTTLRHTIILVSEASLVTIQVRLHLSTTIAILIFEKQ